MRAIESYYEREESPALAVGEVQKEILTKEGIVRTLYDLTSGTGGMLSISEE
jgi:hypothetical protein